MADDTADLTPSRLPPSHGSARGSLSPSPAHPSPAGVPPAAAMPPGVGDPEDVDRLISRMKRIEGQARGVQRMLQEGRPCQEVITQLVAMREALSRVGMAIVAKHMEKCLAGNMDKDEAMQRTTDLMLRLS